MNRWALLKHEIYKNEIYDIHYDFLIENGKDCLTWKISNLPEIDGISVEIKEHFNHRLIWLSTESKVLTNNRGFVQRVDYGTFINLERNLNKERFSLILKGNAINAILKKTGSFCRLFSLNNK
tara:strand:+ start:386 stop:754 length:369 start_codon:yes stop_codon:yes gene_type:complete